MGFDILPDIVRVLDKDPALYRNADPFPHIVLDDVLPKSVLDKLIEEFPSPSSDIWNERIKEAYQLKLASNKVDVAPPVIRDVMYQLNSGTALQALEKLTGEGPLIPDPYFDGGGMHQIEKGGHLTVHADFAKGRRLPIYRRINLLLYLNPGWQESYGGKLELWDRECKAKVKEVLPIANRIVIFTTDTTSYHGHPVPLSCPCDRSRRSLALYYYTVDPPGLAHTGGTTRWRMDTAKKDGFKNKTAKFLWRVSNKLGNLASTLETR